MGSASTLPGLDAVHERIRLQLALATERETWVADTAAARLGVEASRAVDEARDLHPLIDLDGALENLAPSADPHHAMQRAIGAFHRREGAVYGSLLGLHGDEAEVVIRLAAWDHGVEVGQRLARERGGPSGPLSTFELLAEVVLEGQPCATTAVLTDESPEQVDWQHAACPYREHWLRTTVPFGGACNVLSAWIRGLVSGIDDGVEYRRPAAIAAGDPRCEHVLVKIDGHR